jgi:hypothetical protein
MELVCHDVNGDMDWKYDAATRSYFRFNQEGKGEGVIAGQYLPDPHLLWRNRCIAFGGVSFTSPEGVKLKPQVATFALWDHWMGTKNADTDNLLLAV